MKISNEEMEKLKIELTKSFLKQRLLRSGLLKTSDMSTPFRGV